MSRFRRFGRLLAASTVSSLAVAGVNAASAQETSDNTVTISVTNFTDLHGWLEQDDFSDLREGDLGRLGAANLAALMDHVGEDNDYQLRTTSGDNVGGSAPISAVQQDEPTLDALNAMGIDVSAVGNHEFDRGMDDLTDRIIPRSDYPVLGANVLDASGEPALEPSVTQDIGGVKVGIIGTVTDITPNKVAPSAIEGLTFTDPVAAANAEAKKLKESGDADVVVVLQHEDIITHGGFNEHVDAAFGGDSHLRHLIEPENKAQSLEHGKVLTELEITYDTSAGEILATEWEQYDSESYPALNLTPDPEVASIVDAAATQFDIIGNEVIAHSDVPFYRGSNPGEESGSNRGVESTLNNMLAESNRQAMNDFLGEEQIDLGLMNAGGVRADLAAGDITFANALEIQPFGNNLAYATMSGQAILDALERQWQPGNSRPRLSLGVSDNVSYSYDPNAADGERIIEVYIDDEPLDPAADYQVATATFLFEGGDSFIDPADVRGLTDVGLLDVTAFSDYLGADGNPSLRTGQGEIGVTGHENLEAGGTSRIEMTSLNYSTEGEPMAETVTVEFAGETYTADIDNSTTATDAGYGEFGRAAVEITVPDTVTGEETMVVTTDTGTEISVPVVVDGQAPDTDTPPSDGGATEGSSFGSSGGIGALLAFAAVIAAGTGAAWTIYPSVRAIAADMGIHLPEAPTVNLPL